MLVMAALEGSGTLKMANWRLRRLGISFLPPPGTFMQATYLHTANKLDDCGCLHQARSEATPPEEARHLVSATKRMSPIGFSREYRPPCDSSCRTASFVIWSPHSFTNGMLRSSMKTVICLPPGGPYVRPCRFSTLPCTASLVFFQVVEVLGCLNEPRRQGKGQWRPLTSTVS